MTRAPDGGDGTSPDGAVPEAGVPEVVIERGTQRWTEEVRASHKRVVKPAATTASRSSEGPPPMPAPGPPLGRSPVRADQHMERLMRAVPPSQDTSAPLGETVLPLSAPLPLEEGPRGWLVGWAVTGGALVGLIYWFAQSGAEISHPLVASVSGEMGNLAPAVSFAAVADGLAGSPANVEGRQEPGGLRVAPPGTSPEAEAAFSSLPIGAADLPPVGGIGHSGIHVDRIATGARYERGGHCADVKRVYSISARERVNVCIRVVHPREKEDVTIYWEKDGGTMRRSQIPIVPMHAYRTRAYLVLRREYVGDWTVRVHSADGVELAQDSFRVVE